MKRTGGGGEELCLEKTRHHGAGREAGQCRELSLDVDSIYIHIYRIGFVQNARVGTGRTQRRGDMEKVDFSLGR